MSTLDLTYESKWWVLLPGGFPSASDATVGDWAGRLVDSLNLQPQWDTPDYRPLLPQLLSEQYLGFDENRTAVLWYVPYGLPASGYVEVTLTDRPEGFDTSTTSIMQGITSAIDMFPQRVTSANLGEGLGFTRISRPQEDDPDEVHGFAEMAYIFWPGNSLVALSAKSREPGIIGIMGPELWSIVESIAINE